MSDEDRDRGARYMAEIHRLREENERQAAELAEAKAEIVRIKQEGHNCYYDCCAKSEVAAAERAAVAGERERCAAFVETHVVNLNGTRPKEVMASPWEKPDVVHQDTRDRLDAIAAKLEENNAKSQ